MIMMMKRQRVVLLISWAVVFLLLAFIFILSSQPSKQSNGLSKEVTADIIHTAGQVMDLGLRELSGRQLIDHFNHLVRKCAHAGIYFVLGILMMNAWGQSGIRGYKGFIFALVCCVIYAASDEFHQIFVAGRGPKVTDVLIDSAGAIVGIGVYNVLRAVTMRDC